MKNDFPAMMNEETPTHVHNVDHTEKMYGGDGHKQHHEMFGQHAAGHKKHHEHVQAMCGGGMSGRKK